MPGIETLNKLANVGSAKNSVVSTCCALFCSQQQLVTRHESLTGFHSVMGKIEHECTGSCIKRVAIIGNGGAGKSTLAIALGKAKNLPVHHLDQIIWKPGFEAITEEKFTDAHQKLIQQGAWIIEGMGYDSTIEDRFRASDTFIFLDFPLYVHIYRAVKRSLLSVIQKPAGWAKGCHPLANLGYTIRIILDIHRNTRAYILKLMGKYKDKDLFHIQTNRELREFYSMMPST